MAITTVGGSVVTVGGSSSVGNGTTFGDLIEKVYRLVWAEPSGTN